MLCIRNAKSNEVFTSHNPNEQGETKIKCWYKNEQERKLEPIFVPASNRIISCCAYAYQEMTLRSCAALLCRAKYNSTFHAWLGHYVMAIAVIMYKRKFAHL